jgi:hypothetical protein
MDKTFDRVSTEAFSVSPSLRITGLTKIAAGVFRTFGGVA